MMTDTIIANMPPDGLRTILRGLLGVDPKVTAKLNELAVNYLNATRPSSYPQLFECGQFPEVTSTFDGFRNRYRCLMGCGLGFSSMEHLVEVIRQVQAMGLLEEKDIPESFMDILAIVDGDIVQSVTAVQKELLTTSGFRVISAQESQTIDNLRSLLIECKEQAEHLDQDFAFDRGLSRIRKQCGELSADLRRKNAVVYKNPSTSDKKPNKIERVQLGKSLVPRIFMGLWQFSSPAWGTASTSKIHKDFRKHVDAGYTAYGMFPRFLSWFDS